MSVSKDVATLLGRIVDGVQKVGVLIADIAAGSREQALGIDQINRAVGILDQSTQATAANAVHAADASHALAAQAGQLDTAVDELTGVVGSSNAPSPALTASRSTSHQLVPAEWDD